MATMAAIEGLLLLVMAVVGALCAVQDIRKSIVPNCWIAAGIMIAAVLQTIDQLFFAREYGAWWLANMAVGDALAILMYAAGLWAAGDAKLFLLMYLFIPTRKSSITKEFPGAVFSAVGWYGFSYCYSLYVAHSPNFSYMYGSLTTLIFALVWIYVCMLILFLGAELNTLIASQTLRPLLPKFSRKKKKEAEKT